MNFYTIVLLSVIVVINYIYFVVGKNVSTFDMGRFKLFFVVVFSITIAFKTDNIKDAKSYMNVFANASAWLKQIDKIDLTQKYHSYEVGWIYLNYAFSRLINSVRIFFFFVAMFNTTVIPKYISKMVDKQEDECLLTVMYISWYGILYSCIALRAGMMIALCMMAIYYYRNSRYFLFILFFGLAFLIQRSCVFFLVFLLLDRLMGGKQRFNTKSLFRFVLFLFVLLPINIGSITSKLMDKLLLSLLTSVGLGNYYLSYVGDLNVGGDVGIARTLLLAACAFLFFLAVRSEYELTNFIFIAITVATIILVFFSGMRAASRVYDMGYIFILPVGAYVFHSFEETEDAWSLLGYAFFYFVMILISINTCFVFR